jgi:hypothetical protein
MTKDLKKGCGKKMRNWKNWRVQEHYSCGEVVQTGWGSGYLALCKDCRSKLKEMKK